MQRSPLSPASVRAFVMGLPILLLAGLGATVTLQGCFGGVSDEGLAEDDLHGCGGYVSSYGYGYGRRCRPPTAYGSYGTWPTYGYYSP